MLLVLPASAGFPEAARPKLVVGGDHDNPPYEYLASGKPTGFDVELIQAAAGVVGFDVELRLGPWNVVRRDLEQGKIDLVAGMYYSAERSRLVDFSVPHTMVSSALFVRNGSPIRSFEDIRGKEIIVQEADVMHDLLEKERLASRIITVSDPGDVLKLLASGKHDCAFMPSMLQGEYFLKKFNLTNIRSVNIGRPPLRYCFAVQKRNKELLYKLDEGLNILKTTGKYQEIYEKWFGVYEKKSWWAIIKYFVLALAVIAVLFLSSLFWSRSLRRQVRIRTAELHKSEDELRKAHAELEQRVKERTSELFYSRQMLQQVLDNIPQRIFWKNRSSIFLGCNKPLARDCGYANPGEIIGKTDYETASAATADSYRADDRMVMETGLPKLNYEEPQIKPDGSPAWLRTSKVPLRDKDGGVIGVLGMYEDITQRKQMEEALRESEEKHRAVVDAFDGQIYICSPVYRIEFMNKRLIERTGYDATGLLCYKVLHDRDSPCPWCVNERVLRGETVRWEVQSPKDNRWYYVVNTPIYHADGTISKQAMILDITERKQMEEALRTSEEKYRTLVENVNIAVFRTTNGPPGRLLQANPAMSRLSGYTHEELMQLSVADLYQDPHERKLLLEELLAKGFVKTKEVMMKKKDGTPVCASLTITVQRDEQGGIKWIDGVGEDITERKRAEELLALKTAELERSNKELEHFALVASHDLKSPLTTIGGFAQLLHERYKDRLDEKARKALTHIMKGAHGMDLLITDLLAYARVSSGGRTFAPVHCDTAIGTALSNLQTDIEEHAAVIICDDMPIVHGDKMQFVQLFQNLIGNALKYRCEQPPRIHVSAERLDDPATRSTLRIPNFELKPGWLFSIEDNGIGIDPVYFERIFEIFKRLHHGDKYSGTGIGLAICKRIVERHDGSIWVESEPGRGSTFYFTIPDRAA